MQFPRNRTESRLLQCLPGDVAGQPLIAQTLRELFGFLGGHIGHLLSVRIHELGERCGVDGILVNGIEFGKHTTEHCSYCVGRQSGHAFRLYEPLAVTTCLPGCREVNHVAGHGCHCPSRAAPSSTRPVP